MSAEISITLFVLAISATFFLLPRLLGNFTSNEIANIALNGSCLSIGYFSMLMNIAVIMEFATAAGYSIDALRTYLTVIFLVILMLMFYTIIYMSYRIFELVKLNKKKERGLA